MKEYEKEIELNEQEYENEVELNERFLDYVEIGKIEKVKELLMKGANVDTSNGRALRSASRGGDLEMVKLLLAQPGVEITFNDLDVALYKSNSTIVRLLLEHKPGLAKDAEGNDESTIHLALNTQDTEFIDDIIPFLIDKGADINMCDKDGSTALHLAVYYNLNEACKLLLDHGAATNKRNNEGYTPFHEAILGKRLDLAITLLDHGANINEVDNNGRTALHIIIYKIYSEGLKLLLKRKADVNIADNQGRTPLHLAAYHNNKRFCKALLNSGCEINLMDEDGNTALDLAIQQGSVKCAELLRKYGAKESINIGKAWSGRPSESDPNLAGNVKPVEDLGSSSPDLSDDEAKEKEAKPVEGKWSERILDQQVGKKRKRDDIEESLKGPSL